MLKAVFACFEIAAGLGLRLLPHQRIEDVTGWLVRHQLVEGHSAPLYARLAAALSRFSADSQHFYAFYLATHGGIKLAIVILLMRRIAFAYPLGIAVFSLFILTQMHRWTQTHAPVLLALSLLDGVVIWLTWREWHAARRA